MQRRYLFGPVTAAFAEQNLNRQRRAGTCVAFDTRPGCDLVVEPTATWEAVLARLPSGWRPDFVVLYLPYRTIPACLWSAPVPVIGLAADWNLLWHWYRRCLRRSDLVLTDTAGVEALAREGIRHGRPFNLYGCEQNFLDSVAPEPDRDIDLLFVGNLHAAVQRERLPWLGRLARLGERWRVVIGSGVFGAGYRQLLRRSRIVFNRAIRGECNKRAFEAAAAGALLFQEADNREVPKYFRDHQECVSYTEGNLEALLDYYLEYEEERRKIADAARARVSRYSFEELWEEELTRIEGEWDDLAERARQRPRLEGVDDLLARTWQALGGGPRDDPALAQDLATALVSAPESASLQQALGLAVTLQAQDEGPTHLAVMAEQAVGYFRPAVENTPASVMAGLNLTEALWERGKVPEAVEQARQTLAALEQTTVLDPLDEDVGHFPPGFDLFHVEWERAAWQHAGRPEQAAEAKRALIRWRLHSLLAELTGDLVHYHEAALARPDLPGTRAALGCALARADRFAAASAHLRAAVVGNPFDLPAARALYEVLGRVGDERGQRRLARDCRLLSQAAPEAFPVEGWFAAAPPVGDELASIIILCCNELEYTRHCLESVLRHTRPPYELILVDNGSTDGTPGYLDEVRARPGPARVVVIRNEVNNGFPAGCNQGLAQAHGRYVVFLNNDTIVTPTWLEGLIAGSLQDWPQVGLVGAVTNYSRLPQQIPVDYSDLRGIDAFAARRRREFAGQAQPVDRLTGFCLLVRREVLDRIGGFDEGYGTGFFDDDDFCVRAQQAGFRLLLALDVFVHHFGSRTFTGLGIDCPSQLQQNFRRFADKWGPAESAGYRLQESPTPAPPHPSLEPTTVVSAAPGQRRPAVSLCMIVRNEEANLPACLRTVADLVDEVVVVDTGSADRTKDVARSFHARVVDFPWVDSFAAARNESLHHATGDWAFWMDADDRLDDENRGKLRALFARLDDENVAYSMKCLCLPDRESKGGTVVDHIRLFRNRPEVRWKYRVHEQILPAVRRLGGEVRFADVVIHHVGYQDAALRRRKLDRDLRLLRLEDADHPNDPFTLFNLGSVYLELKQPAQALPLLQRSLERSEPSDSIVRKLYALIIQCHRQLGRTAEAVAACRDGRRHYPHDTELLFLEGLVLREQGDLVGAVACLKEALRAREGDHFASIDTGLQGYKARHNLAVVYQQQRRPAEAEAEWKAALDEQPEFLPARVGLGELYLSQQRWGDLEGVIDNLAARPEGERDAALLRARRHLARKEFPEARVLAEGVIAQAAGEVYPHIILSHILLQEGRDWAAAEKALRAVLTLDPSHSEAQHNLAVLLEQQGRGALPVA